MGSAGMLLFSEMTEAELVALVGRGLQWALEGGPEECPSCRATGDESMCPGHVAVVALRHLHGRLPKT